MPNDKSPPEPETVAQQETGGDCVSRLVLGSSLTPITDQRIELLKRGHSNCVPKWEYFAKEIEREMHKWKAECKRQWMHLSQARHNARAIQNIQWGYEGDCGAARLANLIEEECHRGMISPENDLAEARRNGAPLPEKTSPPLPPATGSLS